MCPCVGFKQKLENKFGMKDNNDEYLPYPNAIVWECKVLPTICKQIWAVRHHQYVGVDRNYLATRERMILIWTSIGMHKLVNFASEFTWWALRLLAIGVLANSSWRTLWLLTIWIDSSCAGRAFWLLAVRVLTDGTCKTNSNTHQIVEIRLPLMVQITRFANFSASKIRNALM